MSLISVYLVGHDRKCDDKEWSTDTRLDTYVIDSWSRSVVAHLLEVHCVDGILVLLLSPKSPRGLLSGRDMVIIRKVS